MRPARAVWTFLASSLLLGGAFAWAQANPRGTASMAGGDVAIEYGRPSAKGRDVLGMVQPDSYWRMGADAATTLTTRVPLLVGDSPVSPGEYTLLGHFVTSSEFHLVVAESVTGSRPDSVAAKVRGEIEHGRSPVEQMTIDFDGDPEDATLVLSWGESRIRVPFRVAP